MSLSQATRQVVAFLYEPSRDHWLTILRVGLGLVTVLYCVLLHSDWNLLLAASGRGLLGRQLSEAALRGESPLIPRVSWIVDIAGQAGINEPATLTAIFLVLLAAGLALIAGFRCRSAAIVSWLLHLSTAKSAGLLSYGVDNFITIGLFYLMLSPLPDSHSLDWKLRGGRTTVDPRLLGFFRRVLQIHLCIIYFFSGLTKALGSGWWDGTNLWRTLTRPPFDTVPAALLVRWQALLPAAGIAVWLIEITYPGMIWPRRTRLVWLGLICAMHAAIGLGLGMYLFALVMIVLNVAAFAPVSLAPARLALAPRSPAAVS